MHAFSYLEIIYNKLRIHKIENKKAVPSAQVSASARLHPDT